MLRALSVSGSIIPMPWPQQWWATWDTDTSGLQHPLSWFTWSIPQWHLYMVASIWRISLLVLTPICKPGRESKTNLPHLGVLMAHKPLILETLLLFENDVALFQNFLWRCVLQRLHLTGDSLKWSEHNRRTELRSCRRFSQMQSHC